MLTEHDKIKWIKADIFIYETALKNGEFLSNTGSMIKVTPEMQNAFAKRIVVLQGQMATILGGMPHG